MPDLKGIGLFLNDICNFLRLLIMKKGNSLMYLPLDRLGQRQTAPLDMMDLEKLKQSVDSAVPSPQDASGLRDRLRSREVR